MDTKSPKQALFIGGVTGLIFFFVLVFTQIPTSPPPTDSLANRKATNPNTTYSIFIDKTIELGFHTEHRQRDERISGLDQVSGAGACALDYDQDGWQDILILSGSGIGHYFGKPKWWQSSIGNQLYRNNQGNGFEPIKDALPEGLTWGMNCTVADFDQDGDPDVFLANKGQNQLLENLGGQFLLVANALYHDQNVWTQDAVAEDFDQDGDLDLYLVNYVDYAPDKGYLEQASGYRGLDEALFEPELFAPTPNQLLRNLGNMRFEDVTDYSGTQDISGRGVSAISPDINQDGLPDILLSNDAGSPNQLFINRGQGRFTEQASRYGLASSTPQRTMSILSQEHSSLTSILVAGSTSSPASILQLNAHQGLAREKTLTGDLSRLTESTQSMAVGDFNLDGIKDIFLANGLLSTDMDSHSHAQAQRDRLLLGDEQGAYKDCAENCFKGLLPISSRQVIAEDFDQDGDLDLFITANNDLVRYLENQTIKLDRSPAVSHLRLQDPKAKQVLAQWLIEDKQFVLATSELGLLAKSTKPATAILALEKLSTMPKLGKGNLASLLAPPIQALRHTSEHVRVAAILALREMEVDYTGRYLISMLYDDSPMVRCALADSLSHFFDEEEAMIRSKKLAISTLVKIAQETEQQGEADLPACMIRALGKSESYRALEPLTTLAQSENQHTQHAALYALQLLKEQQSNALSLTDQIVQRPLDELVEAKPSQDTGVHWSICDVKPEALDDKMSHTYQQASSSQRRYLRQNLQDLSQPIEKRLSVLAAFSREPLLSEYRAALSLFHNNQDPIRFCAARVLMDFAPEKHTKELTELLSLPELTDQEKLAVAQAIRHDSPTAIWNSLLSESLQGTKHIE